MTRAVKQRKLPGNAVVAIQMHLDGVAHHRHHHRKMTMHRALRARRRAAGIDDHGQIAVVEIDIGLDLGLALQQIVEVLKARRCGRAGQIDRHQIDAPLLQRHAPIGLRIEIVVDQRKTHFRMIQDIIHIRRPEHGVDRHPDQAGAVDAEQRFDELDRIVADG